MKQQQQVIPARAVAVLFILEDDAFIQHDLVYFAQVFQPPISTTKAINLNWYWQIKQKFMQNKTSANMCLQQQNRTGIKL